MKNLHVDCLDQLILVVHLQRMILMSVLPTQMTVTTCCNVYCHIVNMYLH